MSFAVVIPAAGSGTRIGAGIPKAFIELGEADCRPTVLDLVVSIFEAIPECSRIVAVVPHELVAEAAAKFAKRNTIQVTAGGATRQQSVLNGVLALSKLVAGSDLKVLVHDAARCFVTQSLIASVVGQIESGTAVTCAVPVVDSLVCVTDETVASYLPRASTYSVQTPQGFLLSELLDAHNLALEQGVQVLDDAALFLGRGQVKVVPGDVCNFKVTTPADLQRADALINLEKAVAFSAVK